MTLESLFMIRILQKQPCRVSGLSTNWIFLSFCSQDGKEYWVGYTVETAEASYPSYLDGGPVVAGKGAWLDWGHNGNWYELDWNRNFNIRCVIIENWVTIVSSSSGSIPATNRAYNEIELLFDSNELLAGNIKTANLQILSNDPYNSPVVIPITMNVSNSVPEAPVVQSININGNHVEISWDPVPGVSSYNIYSDTDPYGSFSTLEASGVTNTNWTHMNAATNRKFYVIKSNY